MENAKSENDRLETTVDEKEYAKLKEMSNLGELDVDFGEPEESEGQQADKSQATQSDLIDVDGQKLTLEEIKEALEISKNPQKFMRSTTQKAQEVAKERAELKELKAKLEKLKEQSKGDEVLEETTSMIGSIAEELDAIKAEKSAESERLEQEEEKARILKSFDNVEKKYPNVKMPRDFNSPEFKAFATRASRMDIAELVAVYDLYHSLNKGSSKPQKVITDEPNSTQDSEYMNRLKGEAKKAGVDFDRLQRYL